jgi:DNA-binding NarL/FixJ family response regulator
MNEGTSAGAARIRVLLAEDHTMVRAGVRSLLEGAGIQVVGEAADGREAVKLAAELRPDVVVVDVAMPNLNGIEATRQLRNDSPRVAVIVLSMHGHRQYIAEALRAGAAGYLLKDAAVSELLNAVREVAAGRVYLSPAISDVALGDYVKIMRNESAPAGVDLLSGREREVLQLIAESKTNSEIAKALKISAHTVDTHRRNIMEKLGIHNVVDLVKFAIRHGITTVE